MALAILFTLLPISTFAESGDELEYSEETAVEISSEPASNDAASEEQATEPEQVPEAVVTDNTDPDVSDDPQIDDTADSAPDADEPASTQEENTTTPEDPAPDPEQTVTERRNVPVLRDARGSLTATLNDGEENEITVTVTGASGEVLTVGAVSGDPHNAAVFSALDHKNSAILGFTLSVADAALTAVSAQVSLTGESLKSIQPGKTRLLRISSTETSTTAKPVDYTLDASTGTICFAATEEELANSEYVLAELIGVDITSFSTMLRSGANWNNTEGKYIWTANSADAGHRFTFRINYDMMVYTAQEADGIQIKIPKQILRDRSGTASGGVEFSVPSEAELTSGEEVGETVYFAYKEDPEDPDSYILYNFREVGGGTFNGYIELAYYTNKTTFQYPDLGFGGTDGQGASVPFTAVLTVDEKESNSDAIPVYFDTHVNITSTEKRYPTLVKTWDTSWGAAPSDADNYWYLIWTVATTVDATQPYTLTIADSSQTDNMQVVGVRWSGQSTFTLAEETPGTTASFDRENQTQVRTRYDTVLTRIPQSVYGLESMNDWTVENRVDVTVTPKDGVDPQTSANSTCVFDYHKPDFYDPEGHFDTWKRGDGAWRQNHNIYYNTSGSGVFNALNMRAGNYTRYDLNEFGTHDGLQGSMTSYGGFDYAVWVWGNPYVLTKNLALKEDEWQADPNYGYFQIPVIYDLLDPKESVYLSQDKTDADEMTPLGRGDFQISSIQYNVVLYDAQLNPDTQTFVNTGTVEYNDYDVLYIYGDYGDGWVLLGTRNYKTGDFTCTENAVSNDGKTLIPNAGLLGYRAVMASTHYSTTIGTVPTYELLNSERVLGVVNNANSIILRNDSYADLYATWPNRSGGSTNDGVPTFSGEDLTRNPWDLTGTPFNEIVMPTGYENANATFYRYFHVQDQYRRDFDYARISQRDSDLGKRIVATNNNTKRARFTISWRVDMTETVTAGDSSSAVPEAKTQEGGVFYDLLPKGATVDLNTVMVTSGREGNYDGAYLPSSAYTIRQLANYGGTGRTMLVVRITEPGTNYSLFYETIHSWESIKDYGAAVYNPVAYQTGNDDIAKGQKDTGGNLRDRDLMAGLDDSNNDQPRFIYAERSFDIAALYAASAGLTKRVRALGDAAFTTSTSTSPNGDYIYRLRFMTNDSMTASNLVFVDNLEAETNPSSQWHGTLAAVDLTQLAAAGADAKVYLNASTVNTADYDGGNEDSFLSSDNGWVPMEEFGDLSKAKAVAIDARKRAGGGDFVLGADQSVSVNLYMKAPAIVEASGNPYPETYNSMSLLWTTTTADGSTSDMHTDTSATTVRYRVTGDVPLTKVSLEDLNETISGATFRLFGTSYYGNSVDLVQTTGSDGTLVFDDVERGTYVLQETATPADWLLDTQEYPVYIDGYGRLWIITDGRSFDKNGEQVLACTEQGENYGKPLIGSVPAADTYLYGNDNRAGKDLLIKNKPRVHADVLFQKVSKLAPIPIEGVSFILSGQSDYGNTIHELATSDENGLVRFPNIEKGTYTLTETVTNEDYVVLTAPLRVKVDDYGNVSLYEVESGTETPLEKSEWVEFDALWQVKNTPRYWDVEFLKVEVRGEYGDLLLPGAVFTLTGTSQHGTVVNLTATSDANGKVSFTHLEEGFYVLTETSAPSGINTDTNPATIGGGVNYLADPLQHIVTVAADGTITIDGLEKHGDDYVFPNTVAKDQEIVVTKVWDDDLGKDDDRPWPQLTLQTSTSFAAEGYTVTFNANGGYFATGSNVNKLRYDAEGTLLSGTYGYPVRTGYAFDGWVLADGSPVDLETYHGPDNITVYAKWIVPVGQDYKFTGEVQEYEVLASGLYKLEVWGAYGGAGKLQNGGGDDTIKGKGGAGGYVSGYVYLNAGEKLYVYVGGTANAITGGWNGGGSFTSVRGVGGYGGGGATDISLCNGEWNSASHLYSRLIVAGGGGGYNGYTREGGSTANSARKGGDAGGASWVGSPGIYTSGVSACAGGQLDRAGTNGATVDNNPIAPSFGIGGSASWSGEGLGAGGGGWYGGGAGSGTAANSSGAGGSSYAWTDSVSVGGKFLSAYYPSDNAEYHPDESHKLVNVVASVRSVDELLETADGYARITYVGSGAAPISGNAVPASPASAAPAAPAAAPSGGSLRNVGEGGETVTYTSVNTLDPTNENGYWTKNDDNTWTYVFKVPGGDVDYVLWEGAGLTYEKDGTSYVYSSEAMEPGYVDILGTQGQKSATIVNSTPRGALNLTKLVSGTSTEQKFVFTVTLKDAAGELLSGNRIYGGVAFQNGVANVSLGDRENLLIAGLPVGTQYSIEEAPVEGYTVGWENKTGTIAANEVAEAICTNTYHPPVVNPVNVTLKKVETGIFETPGSYTVQAIFTNLRPSAAYAYDVTVDGVTETRSFTTTDNGSAAFSVTLTSTTEIVFRELEVGSHYSFIEEAGDYLASYTVADANNCGKVTMQRNGNQEKNRALSTAVETAEEGEAVTVTFTNVLDRTAPLKLKKVIDGWDSGGEFEFDIHIEGLTPGGYYTIAGSRTQADEDTGVIDRTITLQNGEERFIADLPVGAKYQITEKENVWYFPAYTVVDANGGTRIEKAEDANIANAKTLATTLETVNEGEDVTVTFTNRNRTGSLTVTKSVTGNMGNRTKKFTFIVELTDIAGGTVSGTFNCEGGSDTTITFNDGKASVQLANGEVIKILGLPQGINYTVTEDAGSALGYKTTVANNGGQSTEDRSSSGQLNGDTTISFVNDRTVAVPTSADSIPYTALALLAILPAGAILLRRRRQKKEMRG